MAGPLISTLLACLAVLSPQKGVGHTHSIEDIQAELANVKAALATESGKVSQLEKNNAMFLTGFRTLCASLEMIGDGSHADQISTSNGSIKQEVIPLTVKSAKNPDGHSFVELTYQADTEADHFFWFQNTYEWIPDDYISVRSEFYQGIGKVQLTLKTENKTIVLAILKDLAVSLNFGKMMIRFLFNGTELQERSYDPEHISLFRVMLNPSDIISSSESPTELLVSASYDQSQERCNANDISFFEARYYTVNASAAPHSIKSPYIAQNLAHSKDVNKLYYKPINITENKDGATVSLVLDSSLSSNGGMLDIRVGGCIKSRFVRNIEIGHTLYVIPGKGKNPFPPNRVELTKFKKIRSNYLMGFITIGCEAVGNPTPEMSLWRVRPGETDLELTDAIVPRSQISIPFYRYSEYHLATTLDNEGNYTCRAVSGLSISENTYRLIIEEAVKIESIKEQNRRISCNVRGTPPPNYITIYVAPYGEYDFRRNEDGYTDWGNGTSTAWISLRSQDYGNITIGCFSQHALSFDEKIINLYV